MLQSQWTCAIAPVHRILPYRPFLQQQPVGCGAQRCVGATIRLREMFRTMALGWHGLPALASLTLELGPDGEARTMGEQARGCLAVHHIYVEVARDPLAVSVSVCYRCLRLCASHLAAPGAQLGWVE